MSVSPDGDDGTEWRFSVDEVGEDADADAAPDELEAGTPDAENVAFVLLGVLLAAVVIYTAVAGNV
ncbi:MAG: hypothetical protein ABEJ82_06435 [Haloplanus sp.]